MKVLRWDLAGGAVSCALKLKTGQITVLTERYRGVRYNSPNDLAIDSQGRIYFTDPCYGDRSSMEMEIEGVYRIDPDSSGDPNPRAASHSAPKRHRHQSGCQDALSGGQQSRPGWEPHHLGL